METLTSQQSFMHYGADNRCPGPSACTALQPSQHPFRALGVFGGIRFPLFQEVCLLWQTSLVVETEVGKELLMRCRVPLLCTDKLGTRHMSGALATELFMPCFKL